jgi:osmotically-inducible protein OsmY
MSDRAELFDEATKVSAKDGEVILDGPDGVDVKMTPEAAEKTAEELEKGAAEASGQRRMQRMTIRGK